MSKYEYTDFDSDGSPIPPSPTHSPPPSYSPLVVPCSDPPNLPLSQQGGDDDYNNVDAGQVDDEDDDDDEIPEGCLPRPPPPTITMEELWRNAKIMRAARWRNSWLAVAEKLNGQTKQEVEELLPEGVELRREKEEGEGEYNEEDLNEGGDKVENEVE